MAVAQQPQKSDSFQYQMYQPTIDDVDSIYLSATDKSLIANGQAKLAVHRKPSGW